MKQYEDSRYEQWREHVEQILPSLLKRNLIIKPTHAQQVQLQQQQQNEEGGEGDGK
jgi:dynein heavy chain